VPLWKLSTAIVGDLLYEFEMAADVRAADDWEPREKAISVAVAVESNINADDADGASIVPQIYYRYPKAKLQLNQEQLNQYVRVENEEAEALTLVPPHVYETITAYGCNCTQICEVYEWERTDDFDWIPKYWNAGGEFWTKGTIHTVHVEITQGAATTKPQHCMLVIGEFKKHFYMP